MKKSLILTILIFLMTLTAVCGQLLVDAPTQIYTTENEEKSYQIKITNKYDYTIYNVTLEDTEYFTFPMIPELAPNETASEYFQITTEGEFQTLYETAVRFYKISNEPADPKIHDVNIIYSGISPYDITIRKDDTVRWSSGDGNSYTVTEANSSWSYDVVPDGSIQRQFGSEGVYQYFIEETGFVGYITATNNLVDKYIHDPVLDHALGFAVYSYYQTKQFTVVSLIDDFTVSYNGSVEGVLQLAGNGDVIDVQLSDDKGWLRFEQNDFDFSDTELVTFWIEPSDIEFTNQTDQHYTVTITATAENADDYTDELDIFIPLSNLDMMNYAEDNNITIMVIDDVTIEAYMKAYPDRVKLFCEKNIGICPEIEKIEYRNKTEGELATEIAELRQSVDRMKNSMTLVDTTIKGVEKDVTGLKTDVQDVKASASGIDKSLEQERQESKFKKVLKWVIYILIGFVVVVSVSYFLLKREFRFFKLRTG